MTSGVLGGGAQGCGDSRAEAEVATGTVTQNEEAGGGRRQERFVWKLGERKLERAMAEPFFRYNVLFKLKNRKRKVNFYISSFKKRG